MNYYMLQQDTKSQETPRLINWFQAIPVEDMVVERYDRLPQVMVIETTTSPNTQYKELVVSPLLLLPKEAGRLLKAFEPWMEFRDVILWDSEKKKNHKYVFPLLQRYDCLSEKSILNRDKSILEKGILKRENIPDKVLFMPDGVKSRTVFAREDFIEALLQNGFLGYKWIKLEVERDGR